MNVDVRCLSHLDHMTCQLIMSIISFPNIFLGIFIDKNVVVRSNERMHYSKVLEITKIGIQRKNHNENNVQVLYL